MQRRFVSTAPQRLIPGSRPASHRMRPTIQSASGSGSAGRSPTGLRARNTVWGGRPSPIFAQITCRPSGVCRLPRRLPAPKRDVDTGQLRQTPPDR